MKLFRTNLMAKHRRLRRVEVVGETKQALGAVVVVLAVQVVADE